MAQRKRLPFMEVFGRDCLPDLNVILAIVISESIGRELLDEGGFRIIPESQGPRKIENG